MSAPKNRRVLLASRPVGEPSRENFTLVEEAVPQPGEGQMLLRTLWLSVDPYMRGRMSDAKSYAAPVPVGGVMEGGTVARVEASNLPGFKPGDLLEGRTGWQDYALSDGRGLRRLDPAIAPVQTALGVLGMPGMTAWSGLAEIGQPKAGETLVVAAAAGPVGSLVGQIGKLRGCRVVGIAGGAEKCAIVKQEFGFDECLDHRAPDLRKALAAACPNGIDVYFENVGGPVFEAVVPLLNTFARVPVCGIIAHYNDTAPPPGPNRVPGLMRTILSQRITMRGFIVTDFYDRFPAFLKEIGPKVGDGTIRYRESITEGLENAPDAFMGLLRGENLGKALVRVAS